MFAGCDFADVKLMTGLHLLLDEDSAKNCFSGSVMCLATAIRDSLGNDMMLLLPIC